ncbi:MAG TPA: nitroreductase family protein [Polyangiaceae bacterium]|nr:nitroreductase family protein [Polyangiaceae bacterium]
MNILDVIRERHSSRVAFDPDQRIPEEHLQQILEAARWAPTAHNMQNFQVLVVDDRAVLRELCKLQSSISPIFLEENYRQLAFSEDELRQKKVGLLATLFPPSWRTANVAEHSNEPYAHAILGPLIEMSSALLVVVYDASRRAPASEHDALGTMSLGCVLENMWLTAQSLGIGFHVQSMFGEADVERDMRPLLSIPKLFKIAFAVRLGYPTTSPKYLRVRRDLQGFVHRNRFGARSRGAK